MHIIFEIITPGRLPSSGAFCLKNFIAVAKDFMDAC
jgi:hypothetical protein